MVQLPNNNISILAIDDEEDHLLLLSSKLKRLGYEVLISPNAKNMLDLIFEHVPDIILLDIQMNGIDGRVVCMLLKSNTSTCNIPIIIFSGNPELKELSIKCGANGYIEKGFGDALMEKEIIRIASLQ